MHCLMLLLLALAATGRCAQGNWDWEAIAAAYDPDRLATCQAFARHDYRVECLGMHPTRNMLEQDCEQGSNRERQACYMQWDTWTKAAYLCNTYVDVRGYERKNTLLGESEYERCLAFILPERASPLWGAIGRLWNALWGDVGECK